MSDHPVLSDFLFQSLRSRVPPPVCLQLDALERTLRVEHHEHAFRDFFVTAARKLGHNTLLPTAEEAAQWDRLNMTWLDHGTLAEFGRIAILALAAAHLPADGFSAALRDCFDGGDTAERRAILRALPLLPEPERFLQAAAEACRSHVQPVFEAIACENPYPAAYFPDLNFNQMVLKGLFTGTALIRIIGLKRRITPELIRMARDYASERQAAGRSVPPDIDRVIGQMERSTGAAAQ